MSAKNTSYKKYVRKGFTLAELLIVVAIIAVLVAVAIPVFTAQLNKAKYATDLANLRSLMAIGTADFLANGKSTIDGIVYREENDEGGNLWGGSVLNNGDGVPTTIKIVDLEDGHEIETITFTGVSYIEYYDENCTMDESGFAPWGYIESDYGETHEFGNLSD